MTLDLSELFSSLFSPSNEGGETPRFSARAIPEYERYRLAKDARGDPSLLFAVMDEGQRMRRAPIVLEHLDVQFDVDCRILRPDSIVEQGHYTVIRCTRADSSLHSYFLNVASTLVIAVGPNPTREGVVHAVDHFVQLFQKMKEAPRKSIQGLWGELYLMARLRNPALLVRAWHLNPEDRYDFSVDDQRIEVKSASNRIRQHHFSLEQLRSIPDTKVLIASLFVERSGGGTSVIDLVETLRSRIGDNADLLLHIDSVVNATLGENWRHAIEESFDRSLAEESLTFYALDSVPKIVTDIPSGVSNVHFRSDLSEVAPVDVTTYRTFGNLFKAAMKK